MDKILLSHETAKASLFITSVFVNIYKDKFIYLSPVILRQLCIQTLNKCYVYYNNNWILVSLCGIGHTDTCRIFNERKNEEKTRCFKCQAFICSECSKKCEDCVDVIYCKFCLSDKHINNYYNAFICNNTTHSESWISDIFQSDKLPILLNNQIKNILHQFRSQKINLNIINSDDIEECVKYLKYLKY